MDFKPNTNTLVANYLVTFGIVGLIVFLSTRPNKVVEYYYSPEYLSHASYGSSNCASCHTSNWTKVTDKNCSTAGCHTQFIPGKETTPERIALTKNEFGNPIPHFGSILAFHDKVMGQTSCESCHPSHRLPQKGLFNHETIMASMQQMGGIPTDRKVMVKKQADLFHSSAEKFAGKMSCNACHADMSATGETAAVMSAAEIQKMNEPVASPPPLAPTAAAAIPPPTADTALPASTPVPASNPTPGNIATGDIQSMPALGEEKKADAKVTTQGAGLPNLFEAVDKAKEQSVPKTRDDSSVQMPN